MTSEPLAARLLDYIQLRHSTFSPEMQRFLRHAATPGYHPGEHMLAALEQSLPQELRFAKPNQRSSNIEPPFSSQGCRHQCTSFHWWSDELTANYLAMQVTLGFNTEREAGVAFFVVF